ncbi:MFS transporter [Planomonospora parontospora]|uniref:MFS transporter n=1 Tax=Planomonospora parontospora TaxID=58119 RepID=UPI0016715603|nr:MFS transporter [Planomonospora parontospora]GGL13400.1 MFS transporter [Planomonospora parontospora subsp. antibiotica]GII13927.1 MFS transporter [Planomonospora parontospora subsp. antibiotica]
MTAGRTDAPGPATAPDAGRTPVARGLGRRFWILFASSTVSNLSDGVGKVALPLLAVTLTQDPVLVAALSSLTILPWLMFAIVSGALVDRVDRRRAMIAAQLVRTAVVGLLAAAVLAGQAALWMLYAAAFTLGAVETLYDNAAHSMTPSVVRRDQLEKANGRMEAASVVADGFLGAPLASALFVVAAAWPFLANSMGFLLAGVVLLLLPGRYRAGRTAERVGDQANRRPDRQAGGHADGLADGSVDGRPANLRAEMAEGLRWFWNHRLIRGLTVVASLTGAAFQAVMAVMVLFVTDVLELPAAAFGWFVLASATGGVVGGLVVPALVRRWSRAVVMSVALAVPGACFVLIGAFPSPAALAAAMALGGGSLLVWNVLVMSVRQALVPPHLFGRVLGAIRTVLWGLMPLGALGGGLLGRAYGLQTLAVVCGCLLLALMVPLSLILHRHRELLRTLSRPDTVDT